MLRATGRPKPDSLRSTRAGAIWTALPARDQHLLLWLLAGDIVTAQARVAPRLRAAADRPAPAGPPRRARPAARRSGRRAPSAPRPPRLRADTRRRGSTSSGSPGRRVGPTGRPTPRLGAVHQLATLDLFAAFLRPRDPCSCEGLVAWVPERACGGLFDGFLRPDALAAIRVGRPGDPRCSSSATSGPSGARCSPRRSAAIGRSSPPARGDATVGFVVESERRARTVLAMAGATGSSPPTSRSSSRSPPRLRRARRCSLARRPAPLHHDRPSGASVAADAPILAPRCLVDPDALACLDERALQSVERWLLAGEAAPAAR